MTADRSPDPWKALESAWLEPSGPEESEADAWQRVALRAEKLGRRQERIGRWIRITEWLVCVIFGAPALWWLWQGSPSLRVAGGFVLTIIVGTAALRRRAWRSPMDLADQAPDAYVESLLVRNASAYDGIRFGYVLLAVQITFFVIWLPWNAHTEADVLNSYLFLAAWALVFVVGFELCRRYLHRERDRLQGLRAELDEPPSTFR